MWSVNWTMKRSPASKRLNTATTDSPCQGGGLKQMLSDMAASGVWDVESDDEPIEPRLIP